MKKFKFKHVIWDWNGTIIDDMPLAVDVVNFMLKSYNLRLLTQEDYTAFFDHPVSEFYKTIGFDLNVIPYEKITLEFSRGYRAGLKNCSLQPGAIEALTTLQTLGISQSILSASHQQALKQAISSFGIESYFQHLIGLNNYLAHSKIEEGMKFVQTLPLQPREILLVGDTTHDYEVAQALGCECILVSKGHQSTERLKQTGAVVLNSLEQFPCALSR